MIDPLFLGFGLVLAALGAAGAVHLARQRDEDAGRDDLPAWERGFRSARRPRRATVAGLLMFEGVAIPLGDALLTAAGPAGAGPWLTAYLLALLAPPAGMVLLALADGFASAVHTRDQLADVRARQAALEHELRAARAAAKTLTKAADGATRRAARNRLRDYSFDE